MEIRKFRKQDAQEIYKLVVEVFRDFVASDFTEKGRKEFLSHQTPEEILKRYKKTDLFVVIIDDKIVGMIEGNKKDKIIRLFVDRKFHGKGIATKLMNKVEKMYKRKGAHKMRVWSSNYALDFYKKRGYRKSRGLVKHKDGLIYQPMGKLLK